MMIDPLRRDDKTPSAQGKRQGEATPWISILPLRPGKAESEPRDLSFRGAALLAHRRTMTRADRVHSRVAKRMYTGLWIAVSGPVAVICQQKKKLSASAGRMQATQASAKEYILLSCVFSFPQRAGLG